MKQYITGHDILLKCWLPDVPTGSPSANGLLAGWKETSAVVYRNRRQAPKSHVDRRDQWVISGILYVLKVGERGDGRMADRWKAPDKFLGRLGGC